MKENVTVKREHDIQSKRNASAFAVCQCMVFVLVTLAKVKTGINNDLRILLFSAKIIIFLDGLGYIDLFFFG